MKGVNRKALAKDHFICRTRAVHFEPNCVACHREGKVKGDYALHLNMHLRPIM